MSEFRGVMDQMSVFFHSICFCFVFLFISCVEDGKKTKETLFHCG